MKAQASAAAAEILKHAWLCESGSKTYHGLA